MRKVTKGKVTIKLWDLGGQPRFRSMWERYCRGVHAIVYVVDSADPDNIATSKSELHDLLAKPALEGIPVRCRLSIPTATLGSSPSALRCLIARLPCRPGSPRGLYPVPCTLAHPEVQHPT